MATYADFFKKNQYNIQDVVKKSQVWFQQQTILLNKQHLQPLKIINASGKRNSSLITPGCMYLFGYDAKMQDTLPYWDMYPLVFPFATTKKGFIGLNMHYLPYMMRIRLLDKLMEFSNNKLLNDTTKLQYSWSTIKGVSRFKIAQPCVHQYLNDHVQTKFKKIDSSDWATALMMPVERFVGAAKQRVWTESLK